MTSKIIKTVRYRRKRSKKTDYNKRLNLLKSKIPRLVVRKTNKHIIVQVIEYNPKGDKVLSACNSSELKKYGWNFSESNIPAAYLSGLLLSKKIKVKKAILDIGLQTPVSGSVIFAALKGCMDGGLNIPCNQKIFPPEDRIKGKHISEKLQKEFEKIKQNILKGNKK